MTPQELKESIDLAAFVRDCGIELKQHGRDWIGVCPFHEDSNPSLVVTPSKQLWHCMGCDRGGSVIDFVMEREDCTLHEALERLKEESPSHPPKLVTGAAGSLVTDHSPLSPERAAQLLERTIVYYEKKLTEKACWDYLGSRGLAGAGAKLLGRIRAGYSDGTLLQILPTSGPVHDELKAIGILTEHGAEHFNNCLVFPVFDLDGGVTTLYGRHLGNGAKRHVYLPDRPTGFWNIAAARTFHDVILVESVIDALSVIVAGYENVISIQGTNGMSTEGAQLLKSCGVRGIRILMDSDKAGKAAAARLRETLADDFACEILELPGEHDPNSFLMEYGASKLAEFLSSSRIRQSSRSAETGVTAKDGFDVVCGPRRYRVVGVERNKRRLRATVRLEHTGKLHIDTLDLYSSRARQQLVKDLCRVFELDPNTAEADINRILLACESEAGQANSAEQARIEAENQPQISEEEERLAREFGRSENLIDRILRDFETCSLVGEQTNKLLCYLAMTSRKMTEPLSVLILSSSGAGKTALQDGALAFCPPEDLVKLTSLSGKALFYKERLSLKHKVLALEEGAGAEEAGYAIRNLISADTLTTEVTVRDPATGNMTTMQNTVEGPTAVFVTTTNPQVDPETKSRFLVTGIDESRQQTRRILAFQRKRHGMTGLDDNLAAEQVVDRHRSFQRLLEPLTVINNHADQLTFDDDRLQSRRLQPQYLSLINAVAFLRQMTKRVHLHNGVRYIEVDEEDVEIGNRVAVEILGRTLDELSIPARNLLDLTREMVHQKIDQLKEERPEMTTCDFTFSRKDLREFTGWTQTRMRNHLKELLDLEYMVLDSGGNGRALQLYRLIYNGEGDDGGKFIPGCPTKSPLNQV